MIILIQTYDNYVLFWKDIIRGAIMKLIIDTSNVEIVSSILQHSAVIVCILDDILIIVDGIDIVAFKFQII
jgi:hypothetical protein